MAAFDVDVAIAGRKGKIQRGSEARSPRRAARHYGARRAGGRGDLRGTDWSVAAALAATFRGAWALVWALVEARSSTRPPTCLFAWRVASQSTCRAKKRRRKNQHFE